MSIQRKAFTLIELMVSIAIFSLIASISYYSLSASFKSNEIQGRHSKELFQLQKTLNFLERDITQTSNQKITLDSFGLTLSSLQNDQLLTIQYSVNSNQLLRNDISNTSEPIILGLLNQINAPIIRVLDQENQWHIKWSFSEEKFARAIEIKFKHPYWGDLIKLVMIDE